MSDGNGKSKGLIGGFFELRRERLETRLEELKLRRAEIAVLEAAAWRNHDYLKTKYEDPDEAKWMMLGGSSEKSLELGDQETMRQQATRLFYRDPHARNQIRLVEKYVVGRGFMLKSMSTNEEVQQHWETFWRVNRMELRKKEIVRRAMRDGETFLRYFLDKAEPGLLHVRFMNPDAVTDPDKQDDVVGDLQHGIETDKEDVETPIAYWYKNERIPAEEVQHIKINVDSDVRRGRSYLETNLKYLAMHKDWLANRMKLNSVRSIVALIRKVSGTPTQAANIADGYKTQTRFAPDDTEYHRAPEGVSIITTNKGVDYELKSPNLQAADAEHDGRNLLLAIAAGAGQPEFMISSDASNANFASTQVAEAPGIREFMDWQDLFGFHFQEMFQRVVKAGIEDAVIREMETVTERRKRMVMDPVTGEKVEVTKEVKVRKPTTLECAVQFPDIVHRDILKETQALNMQYMAGVLSLRTMAARLDLDYDQEREFIEEEDEAEGTEPTADSADEDAAAEAEDDTHRGPPDQPDEPST